MAGGAGGRNERGSARKGESGATRAKANRHRSSIYPMVVGGKSPADEKKAVSVGRKNCPLADRKKGILSRSGENPMVVGGKPYRGRGKNPIAVGGNFTLKWR